jgi:hypothetical protein
MSKLLFYGGIVIAFVLGMTVRSLSDRQARLNDREEIERMRFLVVKWQCKWMTLAVEQPDGEQAIRDFMDSQNEIVVRPPTKKWLDEIIENNNRTKAKEPKREN